MAVSQANVTNKSGVVTSPKTVTQIPIQLGGQIKNQHITLAALNQLTAGKLAGTQINTTGGKTVQIISPAKSTGSKQQANSKPGTNNVILTQTSVSSTTTTSAQAIKVVSSTGTTTSTTPTQYALVRAQLPSSTGGPAQTVTFIRAIGPTASSGSSTSGGTTVSVTPQQMAALLKGQQGVAQSQIQKVLSAAAGGSQIRSPSPLNVANSLKLAATQNSPSKLVSVQFPTKISGKVNPLTTQSTTISPMGTLVSAPKPAASISLVNQFPAVKPSNTNILSKTKLTSSSATTIAVASNILPKEPNKLTADSTTSDVSLDNTASTANHSEKNEAEEKSSDEKPLDTAADTVTTTNVGVAQEENKPDTNAVGDEKPAVDVPMEEQSAMTTTSDSIDPSKAENEVKMDVDNIPPTPAGEKPALDDITMTPDTTTKPEESTTDSSIDSSTLNNADIKQEPADPSVESVAATTLAQLANIASNTSDVDTKSTGSALADISSNPLSTLAALASSSAMASSPVVNGNTKPINLAAIAKKV